MEFDGSSLAIEVSPDTILVFGVWQLGLGMALLLAGVVILILARLLAGRATPAPDATIRVPSVDVASLKVAGPAPTGPWLEFYGTPVRVAVVVLAPVGRNSRAPQREELPQLLEQLVPRLGEVTSAHEPVVHVWPEQLSSQGFSNAFFNNASLPGDRGKGTPWCSVAGKFTAAARQYLIGLVCCGEKENGLSQLIIEHEGRWNDVLRVKS